MTITSTLRDWSTARIPRAIASYMSSVFRASRKLIWSGDVRNGTICLSLAHCLTPESDCAFFTQSTILRSIFCVFTAFHLSWLLRIASGKICMCPLHKINRLEVFPTFVPRSLLLSCCFAQQTEVGIMYSLRQIRHEATGGVAVVLAEPFRVEPYQRRQT